MASSSINVNTMKTLTMEDHFDGVEVKGPICIFGRKGLSDSWKNTKIQKGVTVKVLGSNCFCD